MRTILLVDDNDSLVELFSFFFEGDGWNVLTAPGGMECLELLGHESPDLILLDIMMEPMDGWETLHHIKEKSRWARIPVAMLTGKALSQKEFDTYGMLFEHYLLKPLSENKMVTLSGQILDDYNRVHNVAEAAGNKGIDPSVIDEYLIVHHRVVMTQRMSTCMAPMDITMPWDIGKNEERLRSLEKIFTDRGVSLFVVEGDTGHSGRK
jgi:two-component system, OmpR family, response regulator